MLASQGASRALPRVVGTSPDGSVIAVHKPPGLPFHSMGGTLGLLGTLRNDPSLLAGTSSSSTSSSVSAGRLHAVHRLDTGTSGLVLFATSSHTAGLLAKAFRERRVHKYYLALSTRKPQKKQGSVIGDMVRGRSSTWKLVPKGPQQPPQDPAVTRFWSTALPDVCSGLRLYLLKPETGRTHQLRVAMKSLGVAILGDKLYGPGSTGSSSSNAGNSQPEDGGKDGLLHVGGAGTAGSTAWRADRMYLHAAAIRIQLPGGGWFQAVDLPSEGSLFCNQTVAQACEQLLPQSLSEDYGVWFGDLKLLASSTLS